MEEKFIPACKLPCSAQNVYHLTSLCGFFFFFWYPSNKGHKTFLRKEAVVAQLLETGFGPENEGYPKKFLLSFPCCCHVSPSWAFVLLCRISCCQVLQLLSSSLSLKSHSFPSLFSRVMTTWAWKVWLDWRR